MVEMGGQVGQVRRDPGMLLLGIPPHADAGHADLRAQGPQAPEQAGMGRRAAAADEDPVDGLPPLGQLRQKLARALHIADRPDRRIGRGQVDDVRTAALCPDSVRQVLQRPVGGGLVLALGKGVQLGADDLVEQHIAVAAVERIVLRHPLFHLKMGLQAEPSAHGGTGAHEIGLHRTGDQHGIGPGFDRRAEIEFQLPHLVAAEAGTGAVVALDQQPGPALRHQHLCQIRHLLDRGRQMAVTDAREVGKAPEREGVDLGHRGSRLGLRIRSAIVAQMRARTRRFHQS